jgi:serine/threonine protein kinase
MEAGRQKREEDGLHEQLVRSAVANRLFEGAWSELPPQVGRFRLERRLGAGGMGEVFEAVAQDTGERLAIKMLHARDANALQRLKREFRAISGVVHPYLVRLYELHLEGEHPFLTMELVDGVRLLQHVWPDGRADLERIRTWLRQMVDALETIHASGQLHHDIKPSNLAVRCNGDLVVLDFGLARTIGAISGGLSSGTPI